MLLDKYARVVGEDAVDHLRQLARPLAGKQMVHVNSTRVGGGVAEILDKLVPLTRELEIDARWEVITGSPSFYECTKTMHNAMQGSPFPIREALLRVYEETNRENAERLGSLLTDADIVFIHDPQPAPLIHYLNDRKGKWVWRCHIEASHPYRPVWRYLRRHVAEYDATVFSLAGFAQPLPNPQYIIPPSIDPLSDKNVNLSQREIKAVARRFQIDPERPLVAQISRFDRFKDPIGVINAYRLAKTYVPELQLVLAGGSADDDPEGSVMLAEVQAAAQGDPDIHVLALPPDAHRTINALQRLADIVLQKSLREGFGLAVTEAMWKDKPVIGGDTGGIRLQVVDYYTGFLVNSPEGAALRIRYLLRNPRLIRSMGRQGRRFVRENFLLTRQLREYLALAVGLLHGTTERIELG
ncbi:glycosyltransferase [Acidithiobacillus ferrooxidans]|uniref:Glycosyl transferase, group 1 n=8 Tax=Acidithiobacillus TaxID=119977 RepID=B7J4U3_ACIF2|nr:glycosyltransferase [Acidithiobacillus ferrooxidans]ACK77883.1 glycosyl transferase, group 1 [Acidithiobacillus ferrooxidans ATCC 23270]MBN6746967.1 glycosyltransferase [Acidithiobacillus sp. PG05]ACH83962.1 glycosyl transferase group 1 [Acidithiobacillus ferrooxidans ATCC 53993]MBU2772914.1 glycosyltransferase [Acidithiobacillus ferrooxidans]PZD79907.1 glycosyltransferase [Acidithiobacillus ferrooxidans]